MLNAVRSPGVGSDMLVISLVTVAHFFSHLYILALPPLFPVLTTDLGLSATQLGLAMALLNVTTAALQAPTGVAVDRFGSARILACGQALFALAYVIIGLVPGLFALLLAMVIAGIGNSVYHPADYAVLAGRVAEARTGRAFAIHTFGGYAGFAVAPPLMVGIHALAGWRTALLVVGLAGLAYALVLWLWRHDLEPARARPSAKPTTGEQVKRPGKMALVTSLPILMAFFFFAAISMAHTGFASFGVLALERQHGFDLAAATLPVTAYLVTGAAGVLLGGWIADRVKAHDRFVMAAALLCGVLALPIAFVTLPTALMVALFGVIGLASGAIAPSRDMIVRKLTPKGQTGVVFGFVTTGFNLGGLIAPPLYGVVIDYGAPAGVFLISAFFFLLIIVTLGLRARQTDDT